jgi:hypothetical protein
MKKERSSMDLNKEKIRDTFSRLRAYRPHVRCPPGHRQGSLRLGPTGDDGKW